MRRARGLWQTFRVGETEMRALDGVEFDVAKGVLFVLPGPSGRGKTAEVPRPTGFEEARATMDVYRAVRDL